VDNLGDCYGLIFTDPELRRGLIHNAERIERFRTPPKTGRIARGWLAARLHALAVLIEPGVHNTPRPVISGVSSGPITLNESSGAR
jgi:hypothetical protein